MDSFSLSYGSIFATLNISHLVLLGEGVELFVYNYVNNKILRIYKGANQNMLEYVKSLQKLYEHLAGYELPVLFPKIYEIHIQEQIDGHRYGQILHLDRQLQSDDWHWYLCTSVLRKLEISKPDLLAMLKDVKS